MSLVQTVCKVLERVAPLRLAEQWDNVGLLLEAPVSRPKCNQVLLAIDLTPAVLEESLSSNTAVIVAYHPAIFSGLKSLTLSNPLQRSLLRCVEKGISVYSPHSALDSVWGGINDWLADVILGETGAFRRHARALVAEKMAADGATSEGAEGRLVTLPEAVSLDVLQRRVKEGLKIPHLQVGYGTPNGEPPTEKVKTVAICAGSGGSMLVGKNADVYFTGEMSHHEILAAVSSGKHVILCGHDNTERGYLPILASRLRDEFAKEVLPDGIGSLEVLVSKADRHPLIVV